jgi:cytochrome c oxidase assembly factor CtaG
VSVEPPRRPLSAHRVLWHDLLAAGALVVWVLVLTPPLLALTSEYELAQAFQFVLFAIAIPALIVVGAPWRWFDLASLEDPIVDNDGQEVSAVSPRPLDRWVRRRAASKSHHRTVGYLLLFVAQVVLWRSKFVVDTLIRHPWLSIGESILLVVGGTLLWLELVESAPFRPTTARPYRIAVAAIAMWSVWIVSYVMAMAQHTWYTGFREVSHRLFSLAVDQQLTTALMWFVAAGAFLPVIFSNLLRWLQSEEDPDEELYQLVRRDRTRGFFGTNP